MSLRAKRSNLALVIPLIVILLFPISSFATCWSCIWSNLWFTPNQQGSKLIAKKDYKKAAQKFEAQLWKGYANYKAGNYKKALQNFTKDNSAIANFNRGNTLAHMGQYQEAIDAYKKALSQNSELSDAKFNKALIEKLLKQQENQSQKEEKQNQESQKSQNNSSKNNSSQKNRKENKFSSKDNKENKTQKPANKQKETRQENKQQKSTQPQNKAMQNKAVKKLKQASGKLSPEQEQALKQWLQQIPDNPGGLLKEKFLRDHWRLEEERNRS